MTEENFKKGYMALIAAFPNSKVGEETEKVYWDVLKEISDLDWNFGVRKCLATCGPFFPTIKELGEASVGVEHVEKYFDAWAGRQLTRGREADWRTLLAEKQQETEKPKIEQKAYRLSIAMPDIKFNADEYLARCAEIRKPKDRNLAQKNHVTMKVKCISCGTMCLLPFAAGSERAVICEQCNKIEAAKFPKEKKRVERGARR